METIHEIIPTKENARNSEGAFHRCKDGRIRFFWSKFGAGYWDHEHSDIASILFSADGKEYLGEEKIHFKAKDFNAMNLMCPSVVKAEEGIFLYFLVRTDDLNIYPYAAFSSDDGETFGEPHRCIETDGYMVLENDRVIRLKDGRFFFMISTADTKFDENGKEVYVDHSRVSSYISENGYDFKYVQKFDAPNDRTGHQEPGICPLPDGSYIAFARTITGTQWTTRSFDPLNFPPFKSDDKFPSPRSPMCIKPLYDGRIIAIFNPVPMDPSDTKYKNLGGRRAPLAYKLSDDGYNWSELKILESDLERGYCYTSVLSDNDEFLMLGYCAGSSEDGICLNRQRIVRLTLDEL